MNFELSETRQMLSDTLRRFLADKYDTGLRNSLMDSPRGFSDDIWGQLAELGVIGALFTEDQGGFGGEGGDLAVVFEELGRAGVVEPILDTAVLAGSLLAMLGSDDQKTMIDGIVAGSTHLALAHTEPQARYDLPYVSCSAQGEDQITLNGRKGVVINAEAADALIVSARESGGLRDRDGISLFLVPAGTAGVDLQGYSLAAGGRAAEVTFDTVTLPASARLGPAGQGFAALETAYARASLAQMAEMLGAMHTACEMTQDYLMTRKQFGKPLGSFQALQHRGAEMLIEMEQARSAVINAAGNLNTAPAERDRQISAAKALMGQIAKRIAEESIQMHGGIAMTQEYELAHVAKRIVMGDHRFGDSDYHLERFIDLNAA
jgi:alkylation response protein AidB-like acyl-CoA dehydrogenase